MRKKKQGVALKKKASCDLLYVDDVRLVELVRKLWFAWLGNHRGVKCVKDVRFVRTKEDLACRIECAKRWGFNRKEKR